jgi:ATP-dependent protease ClpP protease subunit
MTNPEAYINSSTKLRFYGDVGVDILAEDVAAALQSAGGAPIDIAIFSYGGDASVGLAINTQLNTYKGKVTITVDGVAASAASLICMAADRLLMPSNALLMLHDPWAKTAGNGATLRTSADQLDKFGLAYRQTYARKSGASEAQVAAWMSAGNGAGTWFTAAEAVAAGLADAVIDPAPTVSASAPRLPAGRFINPPTILAQWATPYPLTSSPEMTSETLPVVIEAPAADGGELSKAEANRQLMITRAATTAGLSADATDAIIASTTTAQAGLLEIVKAHAAPIEARAGQAGHPARQYASPASTQPNGVESLIFAALRGERPAEPLWLALRAAGLGSGNDAQTVWRSALSGENRWLNPQASMSTSDLPNLLQTAGNRRLLERFQLANAGIRRAASVRRLVDYRAASVVDAGLVGTAKVVLEGGEITFGAVDEAAQTYKPARYALGLTFSVEMLANDDLSGLDVALSQLADSMVDAENVALVALLEGAANGKNAPDGSALFATAHANSVTAGPVSIATIGSAVQKLREQKAIGGRFIAQSPMAILCGTAQETNVRQLLSAAINATQSSNVNPWANLEIAVEPRLSGSYVYIVSDGRQPLELGRLTDGPQLTTERQFETSAFRAKSEHVFGSIIAEHRSIVRIPTT